MATPQRLVSWIAAAMLASLPAQAAGQSRDVSETAAPVAMQASAIEHPRSFFLRHIIIDAMWIPTESGTRSVGLIGGHLAIANVGRLYLNGPPGVMVLRTNGVVQTAYTWGFSFQLTEFNVPGTGRRAVLFVSMAKCWTFGDERIGRNVGGLSIGLKR